MARYRGKIKKMIDEKMTDVSFSDFFLTVGLGIGVGLIMAIFDTLNAYSISMTIAISAGATAFLLFTIPRIVAMMKKPAVLRAVGSDLATGMEGERPRMSPRNKIRFIDMDM
jgi:hypothetical protein